MNKNVRISDNHGNWNNGQATYRTRMKRLGQKRSCYECGIDDKRVLVVHHRDKNRKNNNIDNLVWLCCNCHYLVYQHQFELN
jgi:phage gp16-like protein